MSINKTVQKLNNLISDCLNNKDLLTIDRPKFAFHCGNFDNELVKFTLSIVPSGKVCFLHTKKSYSQFGVFLTKLYEKTQRKLINIILDDDFTDDVQNFSNLFSSGEDVRLVVGCDYNLFNVASYLASVRRIDCVLLVNSFLIDGILSPYINVKNGNVLDKFIVNCFRHVYISENFSREYIAEGYAQVLSHITALIDYKVSCEFYPSEIEKAVTEIMQNCISIAYRIMKNNHQKQLEKLLYACFGVELANYLSQGRLKEISSSEAVAKIYSNDKIERIRISFLGMLAILQIYDLYLSCEEEVFNLPNYFQRAEIISNNYPIGSVDILKKLIQQAKVVKKKKVDNLQNLPDIKVQLAKIQNLISSMRQTFVALQGRTQIEIEKFSLAVKHSGDLTNYINLMSLVREKGILDYVE